MPNFTFAAVCMDSWKKTTT